MRIGVVGGGTVGRAIARAYLEHAQVLVYDLVEERRTHDLPDLRRCDVVFLCLPEQSVDDHLGRCWHGSEVVLVLKSTVPIGTTRRMTEKHGLANLVHSPEFLTARCSLVDAQIPSRNVIGGPMRHARGVVADLYRKRFPGVPLFLCTSDESEAIKLICNGFFAVKVAYFNEVRRMADALNLDWDKIMAGVLADGRIAHAHTAVPGPDGRRGFGGACLPKDLKTLIESIHLGGEVPKVTLAALERNSIDRQEGGALCST